MEPIVYVSVNIRNAINRNAEKTMALYEEIANEDFDTRQGLPKKT